MKKVPKLLLGAVAVAIVLAIASVGFMTLTPALAQDTEPTVTPLGPEVRHIDPVPWGLMYRYAAQEAGLTSRIELEIYTDSTITTSKSLSDQITEAGGSHISGDNWRVPLSALQGVVQRADTVVIKEVPGVTGQAYTPAYDRMAGSLEGAVAAYRAQVPDSEAASKVFISSGTKVGVIIDATSASQERTIRTWLTGQGITPISPVAGADTSEKGASCTPASTEGAPPEEYCRTNRAGRDANKPNGPAAKRDGRPRQRYPQHA